MTKRTPCEVLHHYTASPYGYDVHHPENDPADPFHRDQWADACALARRFAAKYGEGSVCIAGTRHGEPLATFRD